MTAPDIVERLRYVACCTDADPAIEAASAGLLDAAADRIEELETALRNAESALSCNDIAVATTIIRAALGKDRT